jgi:hydrogenase-4 component E
VTGIADLVLFCVIVIDLAILLTSRVSLGVHMIALQGLALAVLPLCFWWTGAVASLGHALLMSALSLTVKAILVPWLLQRSIQQSHVYREMEPFVGLTGSIFIGTCLVLASFWLGNILQVPIPTPSRLIVPAAFATVLNGFLVLVSRKQAITQVLGYIMIENGIFVFGQLLAHALPLVVELGILLDLLGGIFVMGIAIHNISREFDHIDTEQLANLKD